MTIPMHGARSNQLTWSRAADVREIEFLGQLKMSRKRGALAVGILTVIAVTMCLVCSTGLARQFSPYLFIAGDGFTLEQAMSDARSQRAPQDPPTYKLLVLGSEIQRITASGASPSVRKLLQEATKRGASIFVCVKDLKTLGLKPKDLLPGIRAIGGYPSKAGVSRDDWEKKLPQAPDQKMQALCSSD